MLNTLVKENNKQNISIENLLKDVYLLPKWEMIKSFALTEKRFFFRKRLVNVDLYRKFSAKNQLEKYSIRTEDERILANMDLKIYKDSVYIINLDIESQTNFEQLVERMLQVAVEKALYNTTEKEVVMNLTAGLIVKNRIRKALLNNGFMTAENQSSYEKEMFGETFSIKVSEDSNWLKTIKQMPILINK